MVKYGFITLIRQTADLCDQLGNVDLKCPLEKGDMILTKKVDLPKQIPPVCCNFCCIRPLRPRLIAVPIRVNTPCMLTS